MNIISEHNCNNCLTRKSSVLHCLNQEEVDQIIQNQKCFNFTPGESIFKEGHYSNGLYIIKKGKVKISKTGFDGRELILRFGLEGDVIGYRSLLSEEPYQSSAFAINSCSICFLPKESVKTIIFKNSNVNASFFKLLASDLKNAETRTLKLAQKNVRERVAETLILLKELYGFETNSNTINIKLSREEIAGIAGTVRESASRYLSEFNDIGIIELIGKKINIKDFTKLSIAANLVD